MKKLILLSLFLVLAFPSIAPAQTFSSEQQATLQSLNQTLISLLTQMIAQLQAQIAELIAQQTTQQAQLGVVEQKVNTVVQNTTPVPSPTPVAPSVSFGTPYCDPNNAPHKDKAKVPITISGGNWKYGSAVADVADPNDTWTGGGFFNAMQPTEYHKITVQNNWGTTTINTTLGKTLKLLSNEPVAEYTYSQEIFVGDVCQ